MAENALVQQKDQRNDLATTEGLRNVATFNPRVDILETEDELRLYVDMPGVKAEDLDIRFENNQLEIYGKCHSGQPPANYLYYEYGIGDFYRAFRITEQIDADKITADLKHGVLTVHAPKSEALKPKRISVKAS